MIPLTTPHRTTGTRHIGLLLLTLPPLAFLGLFYLYPLITILIRSFTTPPTATGSGWHELIATPYYLRVLGFTIGQAALSTLLTLLVGLPGAHVMARYTFPGKRLLQALTTIPFVLPTLVVASAFTALVGNRGILNTLLMHILNLNTPPIRLQHTFPLILIAHVFYNYILVVRIVGTFWSNLAPHVEEAARLLGANRYLVLREVTLPLLAPAIGAAALLIFSFCFTSFGVILILGGPRFATLEVEIYRQTVQFFNLPTAAGLALVQLILTSVSMFAYTRLQDRLSHPVDYRSARALQHPPRTPLERLWVSANAAIMFILLLAPLFALVWRSFTLDGTPTLRFYRELFINRTGSIFFVPPYQAIRNSLGYALATTLLATFLGVLTAFLFSRRQGDLTAFLDPLLMLPLGTSSVTLGLGYVLSMGRWLTSPLLIPAAHTLIALPFVVRSVLPVLQGIPPRLREAASTLGATPLRVRIEIDLPIIARALLVGAIFAFTISMGEFGATLLIARPEYPTMPMAIYRALGQPGQLNYGQALAMSTLLMGICTLGILLIERIRGPEGGTF